jgi:SPP1 gp7 family putative phage head morphogenesis protein
LFRLLVLERQTRLMALAMAMAAKPKTVRPVHANRGIEAKYRKALQSLIVEMTNSVEYWMRAAYNRNPPKVAELVDLAEDAKIRQSGPASEVMREFEDVAKRWLRRFDDAAPVIAEAYLRSMFKASDSAFRAALKDAGFAVEFKMTPAMRDAFNASLAENVGLIKSIPEQYLQKVEGAVMRSYSAGRDLESMVKDIKAIYPVTDRRAILISRDQSNKANAVVNRTRQLELGITEAIWIHSHGGKEPRPDHVAANGKRYKIAEGCLISGEHILPGEQINCRCVSRAVLPI